VVEKLESDLMQHIVETKLQPGDRLSKLDELSDTLGISTGKLREQLEVARSLGLVEVKPKVGIRLAEFDFLPAVRFSLLYALSIEPALFEDFSRLRDNIEFGFFREGVALLTPEDHATLKTLIAQAWAKLNGQPIHIPHREHRELHMTFYHRLNNPFVLGLLEAYWEAYEAVGYTMLSEYDYLCRVWTYHENIINAIIENDIDLAYKLLVEHTQLRPHKQRHSNKSSNGAAMMKRNHRL